MTTMATSTASWTPPTPLHMTQPHNYMQGIVGRPARSGSPRGSAELFATHADVDPLFGLQCCAVWNYMQGIVGLHSRRGHPGSVER